MNRPKRGLPFLFAMMVVGCLATTTVFLLPAIRKPPGAQGAAAGKPAGALTLDYQLRGTGQPQTVHLEVAPDPPSRTRGLSGRTVPLRGRAPRRRVRGGRGRTGRYGAAAAGEPAPLGELKPQVKA